MSIKLTKSDICQQGCVFLKIRSYQKDTILQCIDICFIQLSRFYSIDDIMWPSGCERNDCAGDQYRLSICGWDRSYWGNFMYNQTYFE